jgi:hypothetical protein
MLPFSHLLVQAERQFISSSIMVGASRGQRQHASTDKGGEGMARQRLDQSVSTKPSRVGRVWAGDERKRPKLPDDWRLVAPTTASVKDQQLVHHIPHRLRLALSGSLPCTEAGVLPCCLSKAVHNWTRPSIGASAGLAATWRPLRFPLPDMGFFTCCDSERCLSRRGAGNLEALCS